MVTKETVHRCWEERGLIVASLSVHVFLIVSVSADHTLGTTAVKSIPLLGFFWRWGGGRRRRPRDGGEAAACPPPLLSRLIAATAPDGRTDGRRSDAGQRSAHRRRDSPGEDVPRREEITSHCDARTPQTPPDDTAGTHAHHGRLCPDRR